MSPADVDLQQDVLYQLQLGGLGLDGLQQVLGAHRLNELHPAHYLPHLVGLKVADEVEGRAGVGVVVQVGGHLLYPVFTAAVHAARNRRPHGFSRVHLGCGTKKDFLWIASGPQRGFFHLRADLPDIFCNIVHLFHNLSVFQTLAVYNDLIAGPEMVGI